ncbi:MAG: hypothetical protein NT003_02135 [Candidatus Magasanikbacteria bacterium]|nr:hypothetical protein [Candidatus Magasanikbacteria bacterium]
MQKYTKFLWGFLGVAIGVSAIIMSQPEFIKEKMKSIITPKPPIDNVLTPARDLRGTWESSLSGKGIQVYGSFTTGPGTTTVYENGDMELIIDSVTNNVAVGKVRYTNLCVTGQTVLPKPMPSVKIPQKCTADSGYNPITIKVSGSRLDFGTVKVSGATASMQGNFTSDILSGTATVTIPAYGALKGEFHLSRKW